MWYEPPDKDILCASEALVHCSFYKLRHIDNVFSSGTTTFVLLLYVELIVVIAQEHGSKYKTEQR